MTIADRAEMLDQLCADVEALALAGIRAARPQLSEVEVRHELAVRRYGRDLADEAYQHLLER
jgi:hypothetical protein